MAQEQQYSPVSFDGIVPQLDVGDPSSAFLDSVRFARSGMEEQFKMDARQMEANQAVERANQKRYYEELEGLAKLSTKAADKFTEYKNQKTKEKLSQVWADAFVEGADIDEEKLYADYNSDEQAQSETAQVVGEGLSQNLNKMKDPSAMDIADATKLRKYTGLEATVALNAKAEAAMASYGPALNKWLAKVQPDPGAQLGLAVNEFNRRWADATGLSQANPGYTAKRVYPTLRREAAGEAEAYTRGFNAAESAKTRDMLTQQLADDEIGLESYFKQVKGLTKADGKTLMNNDDVWSSLRGKFTPSQLSAMGQETFAVTGKPYSEHPRFNQLMTEARQKENQKYNLFRAEANQIVETGFNQLGPNPTKDQIDSERNRLIAEGNIPIDIIDAQVTRSRRNSAEAQLKRQYSDRIEAWTTSNPGKKIPLSVIGDAPLSVRQQYAGAMEESAEAETKSEMIRETQTFKDFSKDFKAQIKTITEGDIKFANMQTGASDPANYNEYKTEALSDIVSRANALMFDNPALTEDAAFKQAKEAWVKDAKALQAKDSLFDDDTNTFKISGRSTGVQEQVNQRKAVMTATLTNLPQKLNESDYKPTTSPSGYSERVKRIAGRLGLTPKAVIDRARADAGLPALPNTPGDNTLAAVDQPTSAKISYVENPPTELGLRAQIQSGQKLTGDSRARTIAVGKQILAMGYGGVWQHPDFNYDSGFTGSGNEQYHRPGSNSAHNFSEALDIGLAANSPQKLEQLYQYLLKNKKNFGIKKLIYAPKGSGRYDPDGSHWHHVHVSFDHNIK